MFKIKSKENKICCEVCSCIRNGLDGEFFEKKKKLYIPKNRKCYPTQQNKWQRKKRSLIYLYLKKKNK